MTRTSSVPFPQVWDNAEPVTSDRLIACNVQAPLFRRSAQRVDTFPMHQGLFLLPLGSSTNIFFGRFLRTTSGSSEAARRWSSSSANSQPRRMPRAFLNTPFLLASASGHSLKIMGKSLTSGKRPGIPDVRPTGSCSHSSFSSSPLDPLRRAAASG